MEARKLRDFEAFQSTGRVERIDGPQILVRTGRGLLRARRAVSCLVEVALDDIVLCAADESGSAWVLAVLERADGEERAATCLAVEGDLDIRVASGGVRVLARDAIDLVSAKRLALSAPEASWSAGALSVVAQKLSLVSDALVAQVDKARLESTVIESLADRLFQRVKRSYRRVDELDQVRAKHVDYKAEEVLALHGGSTVLTAKELVKVDGTQVHVG